MLLTIDYVEWKEEFQTIKILFESDLYHRHSGNERHFKKDHEILNVFSKSSIQSTARAIVDI